MVLEKQALRAKYKQLRNALPENEVETFSVDIANRCLLLPIWEYTNFHMFLAIEKLKEVNTEFLLSVLSGKDKNIVVATTRFETLQMDLYLLTDSVKLQKNKWGIPEPVNAVPFPIEKVEVVFVPLLAFDIFGNRVGYGKGFYDNYLKTCSEDVLKIGLSFFEAEEQSIASETTDIPLDYCVTPRKIYSFRN